MSIILASNILDKDNIIIQDQCDLPQGHCYGIDNNIGGDKEVWTLNPTKTKVLTKEMYMQCKHCGKYIFEKTIA